MKRTRSKNDAGEWKEELGSRVRYLRKRLAGMTQTELAVYVGFKTADSITRLETGKCEGVNLSILAGLLELARAHGHDANWLLTGHGEMNAAREADTGTTDGLAGAPGARAAVAAADLGELLAALAGRLAGTGASITINDLLSERMAG